MNILQVTYGLFNGGVSNHIITLTKKFTEMGNKVVILSFEIPDTYNEKILLDLGIKIYYLPFNKVKKNPFLILYIIKEIVKIINNENINVIHSHYRKLNPYIEVVSKIMGIPYIWTYHCTGISNRGLFKALSFYGDKSIAISNETKEDLIERLGIDKNKIELVYNGIDTNEYKSYSQDKNYLRKKYKIESDKWVVSVLARMTKIKGQIDAILALDEIRDNENISLVLTGAPSSENYKNDYYENVKEIIRQKGLEDKVKILGFMDSKEILKLSDICLLPSYKEGFPIVCLESMAMGIPIVRTMTSGWQELEHNCELAEIGNIKEIAKKIDILKKDKERYEYLSKDGIKFVSKYFDSEMMCNNLINIYNNVINKKKMK